MNPGDRVLVTPRPGTTVSGHTDQPFEATLVRRNLEGLCWFARDDQGHEWDVLEEVMEVIEDSLKESMRAHLLRMLDEADRKLNESRELGVEARAFLEDARRELGEE